VRESYEESRCLAARHGRGHANPAFGPQENIREAVWTRSKPSRFSTVRFALALTCLPSRATTSRMPYVETCCGIGNSSRAAKRDGASSQLGDSARCANHGPVSCLWAKDSGVIGHWPRNRTTAQPRVGDRVDGRPTAPRGVARFLQPVFALQRRSLLHTGDRSAPIAVPPAVRDLMVDR